MDIVTAVNKRIRQLFKTDNIYTENAEQDIELPAFLIYKVDTIPERLMSNQFRIPSTINIVYMAKDPMDMHHLQEMELEMMMGLEYLWIDGEVLRGDDIIPTIIDNSISMTVTYPYYIRKFKHHGLIDPGEDEDTTNPIDLNNPNVDRPDTDEGKEQELLDPDFNEEIDFMRRLKQNYGRKEK